MSSPASRRDLLSAALGCFALALLIFLGWGCARSNPAEKARTALDAARDQFVAWDLTHQKQLVDSGGDLAAYRAKRSTVVTALLDAYVALAAALTDPTEVALGDLVDSLTKLKEALTALGAPAG